MVKVEVKCRYYKQTKHAIKARYSISGKQRYRCNNYNKYFQLEYSNNACMPEVKEQIVEMAINGSGLRDTKSALKIVINRVILTLKNL